MRRRILQAVAAGAVSAVVLTAAPATSVADTGTGQHPRDGKGAAQKPGGKKVDSRTKGNHPKPSTRGNKGQKGNKGNKGKGGWNKPTKHHHGKDKGAVTGKAIQRHLKKFQAIADANDGNRATGTSGYEASAKYVEKKLRKAGYKPVRQYFDVETFTVSDLTVTVPGVTFTPIAMSYSSSTPEAGVSGALVTPAQAQGCDAAAWSGVDATGKIAVVSRGTCAFADKAAVAGTAGAVGIIVYNNTDGPLNGTLGEPNPNSAPAVGVTQEEGTALLAAAASGATGFFDLQATIETAETFNVIAETKGGNPDNVVMLGAHLDGVEEGPGINDNASGSAAILETAIKLGNDNKGNHGKRGHHGKKGKGHHPKSAIRNKVRFAWWGAEELGLHGSEHYVSDLQTNDPAGLEKLAVYLNFDMVGSPNFIIGVYDADESTYPAPVEVPEGSAAAEKAFTDYFDSIDQPWVDTEFSGRSDYQAFIEAGVPATGLFTGADGTKTEAEVALFGGTAGIAYDPNYHSAGDDITNVNAEALDINGRAIGQITRQFAKSTRAINGVR